MKTTRVVLHPAVTMRMHATGFSLHGPCGTLHMHTPAYDPRNEMAWRHVQDPQTGQAHVLVHAVSTNTLHTFCTLFRTAMANVTQGVLIHMEAVGVGYRIQATDTHVFFRVGLSHHITCVLPPDIRVFVPKPTQLLVFGIDTQRVSDIVAQLRAIKLPEPYKGKGLRRKMEHVLRKEGKKK